MYGQRISKVVAKLKFSRQEVLSAVEDLNGEAFLRFTANEHWTVADTIGHLCAVEARTIQQMEQAFRGEETKAGGHFDVDGWNAHQVALRRGMTRAQLLAELKTNREATLRLLESLSDEDLDRRCWHPDEGEVTVEQLLRMVALHERHHAQQIHQRIAARPDGSPKTLLV